jgi:hypothetical protein
VQQVAVAVAYTVFAAFYATTDSYVYLIPALAIAALWLAAGLAALPGRARWAALVLPLAQLALGWGAADAHGDRAAQAWIDATLAQAQPGAVLVSRQDAHTFALWYAHYAQRARPDVTVVDADLWGYDWYRAGLARETGQPIAPDTTLAEAFGARPVCAVEQERVRCGER